MIAIVVQKFNLTVRQSSRFSLKGISNLALKSISTNNNNIHTDSQQYFPNFFTYKFITSLSLGNYSENRKPKFSFEQWNCKSFRGWTQTWNEFCNPEVIMCTAKSGPNWPYIKILELCFARMLLTPSHLFGRALFYEDAMMIFFPSTAFAARCFNSHESFVFSRKIFLPTKFTVR